MQELAQRYFWIHYDFDANEVIDKREVTAEEYPGLAYEHVVEPLPRALADAIGELPKNSSFKVVRV